MEYVSEIQMSFSAIIPWIIALAVIYVPMIAYIAYELWRAPLVDDYGNIISEPTVDHSLKQTWLTLLNNPTSLGSKINVFSDTR